MVRTDPPASVSASWPPPNFINPERKFLSLHFVSIFMCLLACIFLGLRLYVRAVVLHSFGVDDWLMAICVLPAIGLAVAAFMTTSYGWGIHAWDQRPEWYSPSELISWIIQLMYILNMFLTKVALLVSYLRFSQPGKFRTSVYIVIFVISGWFLGASFATIFECHPVQNYWLSRTYDNCPVNDTARLFASVLISIVTDFVVCLMPLRIIWNIKLPTREKVVLYFLLSLGLIASVASIIRTVVMEPALTTYDVTWDGYSVWIWTCVECDLAIICTSVPCLRPLSKRIFFFLKTNSSLSRTNPSNNRSYQLDGMSRKQTRLGQSVDISELGGTRKEMVPSPSTTQEELLV